MTGEDAGHLVREQQGWPAGSLIVLADAAGASSGRLLAAALAVARARQRKIDARLAILGPAGGKGFLGALLALLGGRAVQWLDRRLDGAQLRAAADVFLQMADADSGSAALDAMACGLPVLLPPSDGAAALVTDGVQGCVLQKPGDVREIGRWLRYLAEPGLRGAMAAQARALAEHHRPLSRAS